MKRFACHRFYASADGCHSRCVVELADDGAFHTHFPLRGEISHTRWLGGIIFLSPHTGMERREGECFDAFLRRVAPSATAGECPLYGWYVTHFDFSRHDFTADSRVLRL